MIFSVRFAYRVALAPMPTLFITATTKCKFEGKTQGVSNVFTALVPLLEKARKDYGAILIPNEPNEITHDLSRAHLQEIVVACVSMYFKSHEDIRGFISAIDPGAGKN